jgi:hypothetical protein
LLPISAPLIDDSFLAEWTGYGWLRRPAAAQLMSGPLWRWLLYIQVRS